MSTYITGHSIVGRIGNIIVGNKKEIYIIQRTDRHVIKKYNSSSTPAVYINLEFGTFKVPGDDNTHLSYPNGMTIDIGNNIYICDTVNSRVVKLNPNFDFVASYDTSSTIGQPYTIMFDDQYLYVVGVYGIVPNLRIEKLSITTFTSVIHSADLLPIGKIFHFPTSICLSFNMDSFFVSGVNFGIYEISSDFLTIIQRIIVDDLGENPKIYMGMTMDENYDYLYLNNGKKLLKVDTSLICVGKSEFISKSLLGLKNGAIGTLLFYNFDRQKVMRYDRNLNFIEDVVVHSGSSISDDAYEIMDYVEKLN
jgi:hypothetical protein